MHPVQVIAVTSGKGGVGKTNVSVNLSLALSELGRRVILLDADLGLSSIDTSLGLTPQLTLADVIEGRCDLPDVLIQGPGGIRIVPAAFGSQDMTHLTPAQHAGLIQAFSDVSKNLDVLVIDTAAGISDLVVSFVSAAQEVLVVVCNEPTSIANAYALIRLLNFDHRISRFRVLANMVENQQEGRSLFAQLMKITDRFLDVALQYVGSIPYDECVRKALRKQRALYEAYPYSKSALAFKTIAQKVDRWPLPTNPRGHLEFFVERLVRQTNGDRMGCPPESVLRSKAAKDYANPAPDDETFSNWAPGKR
ncbi:Flagellum site-determining protein YlxH [Pseudomonas fluorescens]|uniref:Flagellum site-determining protein YlxH n=1 Tax=Pseudomonas fluorescens TaxID=294 RepID=A0A8H2NV05_PSEFL|nr:Flagellum site-determining protein YlxH [Pseudomonas fluorescens]